MRSDTPLPSWLLALFALLALALSALGDVPSARAADASPIHGLSPLPGGTAVPEQDRPPGALSDDGGPSPAIFGPQRLTVRFNHSKHVSGLGLTCTTCHTQALTSHQASDSMLPKPTASLSASARKSLKR